MLLTQESIKELFHYEDGKLFNKTKRSKSINVGDEAGTFTAKGYRAVTINRKIHRIHKLIYIYHNGEIADGLYVDHIDRVKSNNNIENLRLVTNQENQWNSNAKGYTFNKSRNKFMATIMANGKQTYLGRFDSEKEARAAYLEAKERLHIINVKEAINSEVNRRPECADPIYGSIISR
jgi:hypothetical protein